MLRVLGVVVAAWGLVESQVPDRTTTVRPLDPVERGQVFGRDASQRALARTTALPGRSRSRRR